ncbi:hypothetical protein GO755_17470 [Spirosoma sp. HMF4905]|uniref:Outer membrane protein beta-barrel domain-containing protein n=1 Tax=Spirosoma arboris TaxID=2682092 RepID=A0A7K1SDF7_9BACT|nr:hypothetical protein [Spirosoma arboris]MVM31842.1 hypothetical protein [Spirosoma arboris]
MARFCVLFYHNLLVFWAGFLTISGSAFAQTLSPPLARWAITVQLAVPIYTPSSSIRSLMEANGLGGASSGFFGTKSYPATQAIPGIGLRVEYFQTHSSMAVNLNLLEGSVEGSSGAYIRWRTISFAPLYSYYSRQRTRRISIGPSVQWLLNETGVDFASIIPGSSRPTRQTSIVPGLVIDAAVRFPARRKFFMELGGRYDAAFGRLHNELKQSGNNRTIDYDLTYNRFTFTVGAGFRLGAHRQQQ